MYLHMRKMTPYIFEASSKRIIITLALRKENKINRKAILPIDHQEEAKPTKTK